MSSLGVPYKKRVAFQTELIRRSGEKTAVAQWPLRKRGKCLPTPMATNARKAVRKARPSQQKSQRRWSYGLFVCGTSAAFLLSCSSFVDVAPNERRVDLHVLSRRKLCVFLSHREVSTHRTVVPRTSPLGKYALFLPETSPTPIESNHQESPSLVLKLPQERL